jgi:hypothetical protein
MDPNFMNLMLKIKRGCGICNLFNFQDKSFDQWRGVLNFLTSIVVFYIFSRIFCYGRLIRDIRLSFFPFGLEVVSISVVVGLVSLAYII